jgi:predicted phage tail protein
MVREVKLYGALAKFVGQRRFLAEINSAGEAVRMLLANFPGLERHMADQHYKVIVDNYESDLEQIHFPVSQTVKIVPVLGGAGGGTGKILAGVALVAFAIATAGAGSGFLGLGAGLTGTAATGPLAAGFAVQSGFVLGAAASTLIGSIGVALVLGGVSQLISPTPQMGTIGPLGGVGGTGRRQTSTEGTEFDPQESYSFSGIQNTSKQGVPVPVVYGETVVGSVVISAGIDVDTI